MHSTFKLTVIRLKFFAAAQYIIRLLTILEMTVITLLKSIMVFSLFRLEIIIMKKMIKRD